MDIPIISHPPFLLSHEVLNDRGLQITLEERSGSGPAETSPFDDFVSHAIIASPEDSIYQVSWPVVVCFAVRGDPFPTGGHATATISEIGNKTAFLKWVRSESNASPEYIAAMSGGFDEPAELRHWVISSMEARFDVAAPAAPQVVRLGPAIGN
ncbi:hypothetical protein TPR58_21075 [Sphingomonas sp. HF-S3]|uniref:Uncharacterized protein n=2 Tax=Sphingomonas rustica TaxID=3103142 RepID=A0ABV0BDQ9_9SPHN